MKKKLVAGNAMNWYCTHGGNALIAEAGDFPINLIVILLSSGQKARI
jgi:hypothetical protein